MDCCKAVFEVKGREGVVGIVARRIFSSNGLKHSKMLVDFGGICTIAYSRNWDTTVSRVLHI